jgi:hypothetical protein
MQPFLIVRVLTPEAIRLLALQLALESSNSNYVNHQVMRARYYEAYITSGTIPPEMT